jgi:oligosaccharide repeat unit polymerase
MPNHPAISMIKIWIFSLALFLILPFQLTFRKIEVFGVLMMVFSIIMFCVGAFLRTPGIDQSRRTQKFEIDFKTTDYILLTAGSIAIIASLIDIYISGSFSSQVAWDIRSDRTTSLLDGTDSSSSIWFKIGFIFYPSGYVYIARSVIFSRKAQLVKLAIYGFGPLVALSIAIGGRGPLLFSIVILVLSYQARPFINMKERTTTAAQKSKRKKTLVYIGVGLLSLVALNYFISVFIVRASSVGGLENVFELAAQNWGVNFDGFGSSFLRATLGEGTTYLIFVFSWYFVQGMIIGCGVFQSFDGTPGYGIYGVELLMALVRRMNDSYVSDRLYALNDIDAFGYVYSAFATFYVDFWYFGLFFVALWGYLSAAVYYQIWRGDNARWVILGPFVSMGIYFSTINTPIGLSNGFLIWFWLFVAFFSMKTKSRSVKS